MNAAEEIPDEQYGPLVNNHMMVTMLARAMSNGDHVLSTVPNLMYLVIRDKQWQHWIDPHSGKEVRFRPHEFRRFLESPRPEGMETPVHVAARFLTEGTEAFVAFHEAMRGERGGNYNPSGVNQYDEVKCYKITLDQVQESPPTIPIRPAPPPTGTSTSYAIRRLGKQRPDLLEKVKRGELSPHGAMVEGGFVRKAITIPGDPESAGRRLALHFDEDQFVRLSASFRSARQGRQTAT